MNDSSGDPGLIVEIEWECDRAMGRDTGREHCCWSIRYSDGTRIHSDTHGEGAARDHYKKILAENAVKNAAYRLIVDFLSSRMRKPVLDSDGDANLATA